MQWYNQHPLVASLVVGCRAVPLYWEVYTTAERKGQHGGWSVLFCSKSWGMRPWEQEYRKMGFASLKDSVRFLEGYFRFGGTRQV